jgi:peroxiredoxin Q/BCP
MRAAQLLAIAVALALPPAVTFAAAGLKVGDPAPDFSLPGSDGKVHSLAAYRGKQAVVLAWIAKAYAPA